MPTETDRELSEAEILAELTDEERDMLAAARNRLEGNWLPWRALAAERRTVRELRAALSGKTMYDAAAVEREACAAMVEQEASKNFGGFPVYSDSNRERLSLLIARIRARGDDGGAHE